MLSELWLWTRQVDGTAFSRCWRVQKPFQNCLREKGITIRIVVIALIDLVYIQAVLNRSST